MKKGRVKVQIGNFDLAYCLKKGHMVTQTFNVSRAFAPEIEQGQAHDTAADIWALGQVCYQLLCCIDRDVNLQLPSGENTQNLTAEQEVQLLMTNAGNSHWKTQVSAEVKELISYMVLTDP